MSIEDITRAQLPGILPAGAAKRGNQAETTTDSEAGGFRQALDAAVEETAPSAPATTAADVLAVSAEETAKIDKVARDMESLLLYTMLKQMWATLPKNSFFDSGLSTQFFQEMYLEEISKRVSSSGDGIGVAKVIRSELLDKARRTVTPEQMALLDQVQSKLGDSDPATVAKALEMFPAGGLGLPLDPTGE
jgi:hypothetical protein